MVRHAAGRCQRRRGRSAHLQSAGRRCITGQMTCSNSTRNAARCTCTYAGCPRHGVCCDCLSYHRAADELPGCLFTPEQERTYDRRVSYFVSTRR
ncbi:MAG TPA: DUF6485 family protein [Spirochaetia bacterium]|nr:DUF6485 family protein [Spirochaetia bacterium]